jgi:hypothetical protein
MERLEKMKDRLDTLDNLYQAQGEVGLNSDSPKQ